MRIRKNTLLVIALCSMLLMLWGCESPVETFVGEADTAKPLTERRETSTASNRIEKYLTDNQITVLSGPEVQETIDTAKAEAEEEERSEEDADKKASEEDEDSQGSEEKQGDGQKDGTGKKDQTASNDTGSTDKSGSSQGPSDGGSGSAEASQSGGETPAASVETTAQPEAVASSGYFVDASAVLDIVNARRAEAGLGPVSLDGTMCAAAQVRARETVQSFSHTRPDGRDCFSALDEAGVSYYTCGENIAAGFFSADAVMEGWMNSPGHRDNILTPEFGRMGIACYADPSAPYGYYWAQFFAN